MLYRLCDRCGARLDKDFQAQQKASYIMVELSSINKDAINEKIEIDCCVDCATDFYHLVNSFQQYRIMVNATLPNNDQQLEVAMEDN